MFTLDLPSSRLHRGIAFAVLLACGVAGSAFAQIDPGVRGGPADAGGPLPGLAGGDLILFDAAAIRFNEVDSVSGTIDDRTNTATQITGAGLGPGFNGNDCALCHAQPAVGGSSPFTNPQIRISTLDGAKNTVPAFITTNGPTREARFINNPNGTPDGGVHDLFVITGRTDATQDGTTCTAAQPNFPQALAANNVIFRIPTPVFGLGLVENTPDVNLTNDSALVANLQEMEGISSGDFNHSGNDGTITRFGWKAQNKSLLMFAGEAYNVEQGVTNDLFPNERIDLGDCMFNTLPEDTVNEIAVTTTNDPVSNFSSDITNFTLFMRLSAPPTPGPSNLFTQLGNAAFFDVGCGLCHLPFHVTGKSDYGNQSFVTYFPFSDIALHDMGTGLQDQVSQGGADGQQFRSAPLWGVGKRVFFLHDGRTNNLLTAIEDHKSSGSEANQVINNFNLAGPLVQQNILDFLRSL
jgi:CxxC motif-containing protein (DUF1111 family)